MRLVTLIPKPHGIETAAANVVQAFCDLIATECGKQPTRVIAEDLNVDDLTKLGLAATPVQKLCESLRLQHLFADPSVSLRNELGIRSPNDLLVQAYFEDWTEPQLEGFIRQSNQKREQYWLERLLALDCWPVIFICDSQHYTWFWNLLVRHGVEVSGKSRE